MKQACFIFIIIIKLIFVWIHTFLNPETYFFLPQLTIQVSFILEVALVHAVINAILPFDYCSAAPTFPLVGSILQPVIHLHGVVEPS
jgi:hypothetical protein